MSYVLWGDPPEQERPRCPNCDGDHYTTGCHICAMTRAMHALEQVTTSETFFTDPRGDRAGPAIDALRAALASDGGKGGE